MKVVFIGAGNIATSFAAAFEQQGHTVAQIWSRTLDSAHRLAERLTRGRNTLATNCLSDLQTDADLYLLAVRDGVMADTAERLAQVFSQYHATYNEQRLFVHLACTQTLDVLRPLHSFGHTGVLYPFQAFSKTRIVDLSRVAFFTEGDSEVSSTMVRNLALSFSPTVYTATFEQRVYLHLSGCIANNFTNCLYAIAKEVLKSELTPDKQLRMTNKSNNEIYVITAHNAPNVMREIGRLREIVFREAGGGTGKEVDIDEFDTCENCYKQLIVWNPEEEEIIGGYRYLLGADWEYDDKGQPKLATSHMFHFSERFLKEYAYYTAELGRSFVSLPYQSSRMGAKSLFALDNLWDGLGALTVIRPDIKYYFGKMTMYPSYIRKGRDMILYFLKKHFDDKENLIIPMKPLEIDTNPAELEALFCGKNFKEDYKILNGEIRKLGYNIPPLVNAYMGLSPTMKLFGTAINYGFGDVEETGILIAVDEIFENKRKRHIDSFIQEHRDELELTSGANKLIYKNKEQK